MAELVYWIPCPKCAHTIVLLETSLSKIIQCRRLMHTGASFLTFVCQGCMVAFQYDYPNRPAVGVIEEGPKTAECRSQVCFSVVAECEKGESLVELMAIRLPSAGAKQIAEQEMPKWNLTGIHCENDHPLLPPDPMKVSERLRTEDL